MTAYLITHLSPINNQASKHFKPHLHPYMIWVEQFVVPHTTLVVRDLFSVYNFIIALPVHNLKRLAKVKNSMFIYKLSVCWLLLHCEQKCAGSVFFLYTLNLIVWKIRWRSGLALHISVIFDLNFFIICNIVQCYVFHGSDTIDCLARWNIFFDKVISKPLFLFHRFLSSQIKPTISGQINQISNYFPFFQVLTAAACSYDLKSEKPYYVFVCGPGNNFSPAVHRTLVKQFSLLCPPPQSTPEKDDAPVHELFFFCVLRWICFLSPKYDYRAEAVLAFLRCATFGVLFPFHGAWRVFLFLFVEWKLRSGRKQPIQSHFCNFLSWVRFFFIASIATSKHNSWQQNNGEVFLRMPHNFSNTSTIDGIFFR